MERVIQADMEPTGRWILDICVSPLPKRPDGGMASAVPPPLGHARETVELIDEAKLIQSKSGCPTPIRKMATIASPYLVIPGLRRKFFRKMT